MGKNIGKHFILDEPIFSQHEQSRYIHRIIYNMDYRILYTNSFRRLVKDLILIIYLANFFHSVSKYKMDITSWTSVHSIYLRLNSGKNYIKLTRISSNWKCSLYPLE